MWWKTVEEKRKDGTTTSRGYTDDPANADQKPQMTENDHARFLKEAMA
jgi:hypothetical protein